MRTMLSFRHIFIVATTITAAVASSAKELNIYCNDSTFHSVPFTDGLNIRHTTEQDSILSILYNDFYQSDAELKVDIGLIDSCVVKDVTVPALHFTFPDYPDKEWVWNKTDYINATLDIEGFGIVDDAQNLTLSVKGRGNSSWSFMKKPMRLKFPHKTSICNFAEAKSYVLLADFLDPTVMRNAVGLWLAQRLGLKYANHSRPCNVYVNGKYQGLYLLTEKIGINSGSVHIDKNTGILFEMSKEYDEKYKFRSGIWDIPVMVKDPDFDELYAADPSGPTPEERFEMWKNDFNDAADRAVDGIDISGFDIESAVNYLLTVNVVCNNEIGFPKSIYIYKERIGETYKMGPVWDLDVAYNTTKIDEDGKLKEQSPDSPLWVSGVLNMMFDNVEFKEAYKTRFEEFESEIFPELLDFIDNYAKELESSAKMNAMRWPGDYNYVWYYRLGGFDFGKHVNDLKNWLIMRVAALKTRAQNGEL